MLLDRYEELVDKLYCEPKNEVIIGNFLTSVPNENIKLNQRQQQQLAQKKVNRKRKITEELSTSKNDIHYSMRHTLLFSFQYSMFTNNMVTISPFNDSEVIDVVCPLGFKANHFLLY